MIGTVSTEEMAALARRYGCDHAINYQTESFPERVRKITDGRGVDVVYDGVGRATFGGGIECLEPRGYFIGYGNASGNFLDIDPLWLMRQGSIYFQRTAMYGFIRTREDREMMGGEFVCLVRNGSIKIEVNRPYLLSESRQSHIDLQDRKTSGSVVFDSRG